MRIRPLEITDHAKGFLALLRQLTVSPDLEQEHFETIWRQVASNDNYLILVYEDQVPGRIIGTGTLFIEDKFIHQGQKVGHIEDLVVDQQQRQQGIASQILQQLITYARDHNCYKVILNCHPELTIFYQKNGFEPKEIQMTQKLI